MNGERVFGATGVMAAAGCVIGLLVLAGCDIAGAGGRAGDGVGGGGGGSTGAVSLRGTWARAATPCPGSKTNALWFDDRQTGFAGCGENAEGLGLYATSDGGRTWTALPAFADVRVTDLRRGPDGVLYGAGIHTTGGMSAWRIDEAGAALAPVSLFTPGDSAFTSVRQAENVAVAADGSALVDSLTGTTAACRVAGGDFVEMRSLREEAIADPDATGVQVRRVVAFEGGFYASGSVINEPAQVFLPSRLEGATCHLYALELQPPDQDGELLDLHLWSATRAITVGFDQSKRYPLVYVLDGDAYDRAAWAKIELADSDVTYQAGINDIDVAGDVVVAAGEKIPTSGGGCLLRSADGGRTWGDITPELGGARPGPLSAVRIFANGDILAAGGGGEAWIFTAE